MGIPKSVEQAREYSNNINNVDANAMPQNEQNLAIRYALHDIAKQTGQAPEFNFDYSPVDYDDTLSSEIYKPYVNPLQDAFGMLWNAVPSIGAALVSSPTLASAGVIGLLNDALEKVTGDDYDDPKIQELKKNWFYDPAARGSVEWTNAVNDFFDSWKYKPSDKAQEKLDVTDFWKTANPNNVAANIGNGIGSVLGFLGTIYATKGIGGSTGKAFQGLKNISKAEVLGSYMYMNNELYNEFRSNPNVNDVTAAKLSSLIALPIALSEYVGLSALGKVVTQPMKKNAIKSGMKETIEKYGAEGLTKELYQDFTANAIKGINNKLTTAALKGAQGAVIEGVEEYGQGKMQQAAEALYDKVANEKVFGTELFNKEALKEDINNAFWGGAIGGLLGMGGGMMQSKEMEESIFHYVGINLQKNRPAKIDGVKKFISQLQENGKITPEQGEQGLKMVDEMVAIHKEAMPLTLTDIDARYQAYEFIQARNQIQEQLTALDEKPVDPTLAKADSELRTIMEQSAEAYDEAIGLIAKTKGQISESELQKKLFEIGNQFKRVEVEQEMAEVETDITPIQNTEELPITETKVEDVKVEELKAEKVDLAKNEELRKRAEKALKSTITKIEQLKTQPLGAKESQEARDEKILNYEARQKQIETKIGELDAIREAETAAIRNEEAGAVVETAYTGVNEQVVEEVEDTPTGIEEAQQEEIIPEQVQNEGVSEGVNEIQKLQNEYESKSVDELVKLKKELYPNPDIESQMSAEEKLLDKVIAKKYSDLNQAVIEKRKKAKEGSEPSQKSAKKETKKVESEEEKNIKNDITYLEGKMRDAKTNKARNGFKKQINERKKMLKAAKKGEAYVAKKPVKDNRQRGVPKEMNDFVAVDAYSKALQYFGQGGKVSRSSFEDALGLFKTEDNGKGGRKVLKGLEEYRAAFGMFAENASDYTDVANELTDYEGGAAYDEMLLALEEVMSMSKGDINAAIREAVEKMQNGGVSKEKAAKIQAEEMENAQIQEALITSYEENMAAEQEYLANQIGINEQELNEKIQDAKDEVRLAEQAYEERKAQLGRELAKEQPQLFENKKEDVLFEQEANVGQANIDAILSPFKARIDSAKRNLAKIDNEAQRNQAKDLDKRQTSIKFEQDIKTAAMEEGDVLDNMEENGDIKIDCQ